MINGKQLVKVFEIILRQEKEILAHITTLEEMMVGVYGIDVDRYNKALEKNRKICKEE